MNQKVAKMFINPSALVFVLLSAFQFRTLCYAALTLPKAETKSHRNHPTDKVKRKIQTYCPSCSDSEAEGSNDPAFLMRSCVEQICPNPEFSISDTLNKINHLAPSADRQFDREIYPLVRAISNEEAFDKIERSNIILKWLNTKPVLKKTMGVRLFHLFENLSKFSKFQFKPENGRIVIDKELSRPEFSELSENEFDLKVKIAQKILEAFLDKAFNDTDPTRLQLVYGTHFKEKVQEEINSLKKYQQIIEADPELKFLTKLQIYKDLVDAEKVKKQFAAEEINPESLKKLNQTRSVLKLFAELSTDSDFKRLLGSDPIDLKKTAQDLGLDTLLKKQISQYKTLLNGNNLTHSQNCRRAYTIAKLTLPTQKLMTAYTQTSDSLKSKFADGTQVLFCESSTKNYVSQILSLKQNLPLTWENYLSNMKTSLQRGLEKAKKSKSDNTEIDASPDKDIFYSIALISSLQNSDQLVTSAEQICDGLMTNIFPDATYYQNNSYITGPLVIQHPEAAGMTYHTLGHWFYYLKKQNKICENNTFKKVNACLLENHTELSSKEFDIQKNILIQGEGTQYEAEDWADLMSASLEGKDKNFACLFARKLEDSDYASMSLKNNEPTDSHSSELFRLLHIHFLKNGSIPKICEQALSARGERLKLKNCIR